MVYESDSITIQNVNKYFYTLQGQVSALDNINLTIGDGEFFCIVGPSGCGKTTLLRILAELEEASSGKIEIKATNNDRPLNSMVFQEQSILPWMNSHENQNRLKSNLTISFLFTS